MKDVATKTEVSRGTLGSYIAGFIYSLALTLVAYLLVVNHTFSPGAIVVIIVILGLVQLVVQLMFFLHLDKESKPRWNLMVASFAVLVVLILVLGSLWIMNNLNYHSSSPQEINSSIIHDEGIHR